MRPSFRFYLSDMGTDADGNKGTDHCLIDSRTAVPIDVTSISFCTALVPYFKGCELTRYTCELEGNREYISIPLLVWVRSFLHRDMIVLQNDYGQFDHMARTPWGDPVIPYDMCQPSFINPIKEYLRTRS